MTNVIKTVNLTKKFKDTMAVDNISLEIEKGDIYGIVGPNGAGKSTLLKLITGVSTPSSGEIELFESKDLEKGRKRMSAILENPTLFKDMTALDNLEYFRIQRNVPERSKIFEALETVGLDPSSKKNVGKYSVGMKQRLAIALALITNPEIMILDEPISGIDPKGIYEIRNLIKKLALENGVTFIISSHLLSELSNTVTKFLVIDNGKKIKEMTIKQLYDETSNHIILETSDNSKAMALIEEKFKYGVSASENNSVKVLNAGDDISRIIAFLVENKIDVLNANKTHQNLEDYYMNLVGR
ncbi:ABC transporter ATP-binding protein [Citroniella saccharovorans]|uniref:ABC transporter ATP-binding protein n=1 Tax=Citroniella saccharovorans TaxID=2053367 RepID=A0AAW9MXN8_9FIRM|nr:ABC transporter ATP-binding protein [Citroniella saccharovorans]MEB3428802.1 ABC transporter ATP-binding protein [Citroniella saccharovorans]